MLMLTMPIMDMPTMGMDMLLIHTDTGMDVTTDTTDHTDTATGVKNYTDKRNHS